MRKYIFIFNIIIIGYIHINAQSNLVKNYSFEEYNTCPLIDAGIYLRLCNFWNEANYATPDYFHVCDTILTADVPLNFAGYENPRSGLAYTGIILYQGTSLQYREYIQGELKDTLIQNRKYIYRYYYSTPEFLGLNKFCIDNIGMYLSDTQLSYPSISSNIPLPPTAQNPIGNILNHKIGWQKLEGVFMAQGGERYITIGNFQNNANTNIYDCYNNGTSSLLEVYTYIDDVYIIDTSITDTIQLCYNDSVEIGNAYAKSTGMYYDTVEGLIAKTFVQMRPQSGSFTEIDKPYYRGDTLKVGSMKVCYSPISRAPFMYCDSVDPSDSTLCWNYAYIWPTPDTFVDEKFQNIYGCDSTVRYHIRTNVGIDGPNASTYHNMSIYPNPISEYIHIKISGIAYQTSKDIQLEIYDAVGRRIRYEVMSSKTSNEHIEYKLNLRELSSGMYFIQAIGKENRIVGNARFICQP